MSNSRLPNSRLLSPGGNFQTSSYVGPLDPLAEDKLIQVDGDEQGFGQGMAVRLAREYPPLRRKDDARELFEIGDVVRGRRAAADLDVVVVPPQQSLLIEVQCLLCAVGRDVGGEADFQTTPRLACLLPGLEFFGFNVGSGKQKWNIQIRPHLASRQGCELQIPPSGLERVS